jgi:hypothetical protein
LSEQVEAYIKKQPFPQQEIIQNLRTKILNLLPGINEEMKMGVPWYEDKFYIVSLKRHVNLGFSMQGLSDQERALFEGNGKLMRHIKFYSTNDVKKESVAKLIKLIAEKNSSSFHR